MCDDKNALSLSRVLIDVVIAEVKTNQACTLNGPWTNEDGQNVHRVLAAIGCIPSNRIKEAAADIYRTGIHQSDLALRIRLVAVGEARNETLASKYPHVVQVTWAGLLPFTWQRFRDYRRQKRQVDQWDKQRRQIKRIADRSADAKVFVEEVRGLMENFIAERERHRGKAL